jgi:5'-deoxy-5'-methylthioadenosine phosphorylase
MSVRHPPRHPLRVALIAGSGLYALPELADGTDRPVTSRYGAPSAPVRAGRMAGVEILFLPRHGTGHTLPPHRINYRANIDALRTLGATHCIAIAAVGGISAPMGAGRIAIPHQLIDYTHGRAHTFFDGDGDGKGEGDAPGGAAAPAPVTHVDFTHPYDEGLRQALLAAASEAGIDACPYGVYGAVQGPRLETAAEVDRLARDGCDLVGMTGMPEAGLAREAGLPYATLAVVANRAAGRGEGLLSMAQILETLRLGMVEATRCLALALPRIRVG